MKRLLFISLIIFLIGCNGENKSKDAKQREPCKDELIFQLNWFNDPTFTGEYLAFEKNWKIRKLNVKLNEGGIGIDPIAMVSSKKVDYAVVGADKALIAISIGAPITIISVDFQRNPVGWIVRPKLNINKIEDCKNRDDVELGDKAGTEISAILALMLERKEINIKPASVSFDFSYFLTKENSIYPVYLNEEPVKARVTHGINVVEIDPAKKENGKIELYGNVIITHKEKLINCETEVNAIVSGLHEGWVEAIKDPKRAISIVMKYVKGEEEYISGVVNRTLDFVTNMYGKKVPPGHMEKTAWESTIQTLKEAKLLDKDIDLNSSIIILK